MTSKDIMALDNEHVMQTYARFPVAVDHGDGSVLYDADGVKYIDFTSGIGVNSIGYGNKNWLDAITNQAGKLGHISNLFYTEPYAKLSKALCQRSGLAESNVFFSNSGAEANEGAIKLARKYSFDKYGSGRSTIVTLLDSFHGRTITTLAATGQDHFHEFFFPFTEGFRYASANDFESVLEACGDDTCAVMIELVQGEGGVLPLDKEFVCKVESLCREKDMLLIIDEVQTGVGRTGSFFAFQQFGIQPDIVTFAKGIGGGLPLGGFMAAKNVAGVLGYGQHGTTFGGNPICCAAALVVLDTLTDEVISQVIDKGSYIKAEIEKMGDERIAGVRGMGLMLGIPLVGLSHKDMASKLIENGLLTLTAGSDALRFLPPLTVTYEEIDEGLAIFKKTFTELKEG